MGKPGPEDIVDDPPAKEDQSKPESPTEEVVVAENEALKVDNGLAAVEKGDDMKESEMKEDEAIGKLT